MVDEDRQELEIYGKMAGEKTQFSCYFRRHLAR